LLAEMLANVVIRGSVKTQTLHWLVLFQSRSRVTEPATRDKERPRRLGHGV
jgi:hypothetical protein